MSAEADAALLAHRAHDSAELLRQWTREARAARWKLTLLGTSGAFPVPAVESPAARTEPGLYVSAGMHGDEAAPPWALLGWFRENAARLRGRPVSLVPCFNPSGLALNTRADLAGEDLNRQFHRADHPLVTAWAQWLAGARFRLSLCLHEDYDARGIYCYEVYHDRGRQLADRLLTECEGIIPREPRGKIEGRRAKAAVIRRSGIPKDLPGHPEAIALHLTVSDHNLTFETPSEYSLTDRVACQRQFLDAAVASLGW